MKVSAGLSYFCHSIIQFTKLLFLFFALSLSLALNELKASAVHWLLMDGIGHVRLSERWNLLSCSAHCTRLWWTAAVCLFLFILPTLSSCWSHARAVVLLSSAIFRCSVQTTSCSVYGKIFREPITSITCKMPHHWQEWCHLLLAMTTLYL